MRRILVIGGGTYQVPLIKRIKELGYEAYCVDYNENAEGFLYADGFRCVDIMAREKCLEYAKELCIDAVMTYGATITLPTVAYIAKALSLKSLPMETAEISKSKYKIKKALFEAGLNVKGDFFEMHKRDDAKEYSFIYPCVIKPSDGSGSKGVSLVNDSSELEYALNYAFESARFGEVYVEGYVRGEEYSVEVFVNGNDVHVYAIVKTTFVRNSSDNDGISYGHRTPSGLPEKQELIISEEAIKAVRALGVNIGSVNFDI
ncbi:MAG: ATP-grasp domain-containing protein, partial [Oscillospiraceae bacterium]|nr:ATP-grasp domain-containing protein [Oscillospiraceae bacterium]